MFFAHLPPTTDDSPTRPSDETVWMLQQIIENCASGMMLVDAQLPDMPIIYANAAFERLTGYALSDIIGKNSRLLQDNCQTEESLRAIRQTISADQTSVSIIPRQQKDGTTQKNANLNWRSNANAPVCSRSSSGTQPTNSAPRWRSSAPVPTCWLARHCPNSVNNV